MAEEQPTLAEKSPCGDPQRAVALARPNRRFGGRGNGATCPVYGEVVTTIQAEIELEFNRHGPEPGLDRYHLHARCVTAGESERRKIPGSET
jgi:hypothetical protein